jgi:hypothetical protein
MLQVTKPFWVLATQEALRARLDAWMETQEIRDVNMDLEDGSNCNGNDKIYLGRPIISLSFSQKGGNMILVFDAEGRIVTNGNNPSAQLKYSCNVFVAQVVCLYVSKVATQKNTLRCGTYLVVPVDSESPIILALPFLCLHTFIGRFCLNQC